MGHGKKHSRTYVNILNTGDLEENKRFFLSHKLAPAADRWFGRHPFAQARVGFMKVLS